MGMESSRRNTSAAVGGGLALLRVKGLEVLLPKSCSGSGTARFGDRLAACIQRMDGHHVSSRQG